MNFACLDEINQEDDLYEVIGANELSTIDQIRTEFKFKAKKIHPDKISPDDDTVNAHEEFKRLKWAYEILSNEDSRKNYDIWRRSGLAIPFKSWLKMNEASRTSIHWALKPKRNHMLMESQDSETHENNKSSSLKIVDNKYSSAQLDNDKYNLKKSDKKTDRNKPNDFKAQRTVIKRRFNMGSLSRISSKFRKYEI